MQNSVDQIHFPVMSGEVLSFLKINPKGIYCDGTIGVGGHAEKIIQNLSNEGQLIGIDRDENAISLCKERFKSLKKRPTFLKSSNLFEMVFLSTFM